MNHISVDMPHYWLKCTTHPHIHPNPYAFIFLCNTKENCICHIIKLSVHNEFVKLVCSSSSCPELKNGRSLESQ